MLSSPSLTDPYHNLFGGSGGVTDNLLAGAGLSALNQPSTSSLSANAAAAAAAAALAKQMPIIKSSDLTAQMPLNMLIG